MEASPLSSLRHRLRATVCSCFGQGAGGLCDRMRWRRRAGVGEFRYDPLSYALSYALNFDEGDVVDADFDGDEDRKGALLYRSFSSRLPTPAAAVEVAKASLSTFEVTEKPWKADKKLVFRVFSRENDDW